ncbi:MAG TPA: S9 family peptidase [Saprospiraceae bacterium]|nr:S9 family peptidase [Saprospiraceae bacterium]
MKRFFFIAISALMLGNIYGQQLMTPELLWSLGRVNPIGLTPDAKNVVYSVSTPDLEANKSSSEMYQIALDGGFVSEISRSPVPDKNMSPDGRYMISHKEMKVLKIRGNEKYPDLSKSNAYVFDDLMIRHWDTWEEGAFDHVILSTMNNGIATSEMDLMKDEPYDCPQKPFGGDEDYIFGPDGTTVLYVTKKKFGKDYAVSTNTDIYEYDIITKTTRNLTEGRMGYDLNPTYSKRGVLAYLSMRRDGYESDKQDIIILNEGQHINLTAHRDEIHVDSYKWSADGTHIYFTAPINGTVQLFDVPVTYPITATPPAIRQVTSGDFDVTGIVGQSKQTLVVSRTDMNHAAELYTVNLEDGKMAQLTHVNDEAYKKISMVKTERKWVKTTDGKNMLVWVIYPPDFDPAKKYPTLLYCQGGPQSALTQFYSFRWNFQLMASNGYIVVAPNRRGMPGHGTAWNEEISKDHGGQVMDDYLSAIDAVSKETYVDKDRLGAIGASYGGYSVFMLAGIHENRFKSFLAHDGIYDMRSMYGTTEELFFVDWDWGGPYWDMKNKAAQKNYKKFNPVNLVDKWNTPIMIIQGGKDYRVPIEQGLSAFQAAKLKGLNARLLYLPEENHWVLSAQNALVWQREFYKWLQETLPVKGAVPAGKS